MIKREAQAVWRGSKEGQGELTTQSGVLKDVKYSFGTRFQNGPGTNPEELIGAAHAGCFSMALAFSLGAEGFNPQEIRTKSLVSLENKNGGWSVTNIQLTLNARVPEIAEQRFKELANKAKEECPISKLLKAPITLESNLER